MHHGEQLEYFAARAPQKVPKWFRHTFIPEPRPAEPKPPEYHIGLKYDQNIDLTRLEYYALIENWKKDPIYELDFFLSDYQRQMETYFEQCRLIDSENARNDSMARYFQWRKFYAEQMIKILNP